MSDARDGAADEAVAVFHRWNIDGFNQRDTEVQVANMHFRT
jgi:hypothetical protein